MIQIQGVRKRFGSLEVLRGVDLEVAKGEVICILGPSGSGKSTLLRCVNLPAWSSSSSTSSPTRPPWRTSPWRRGGCSANRRPRRRALLERVAIARALANGTPRDALRRGHLRPRPGAGQGVLDKEVGDQVVFMDGGVVVEQGDPKQVLDHPREERTQRFLGLVLER